MRVRITLRFATHCEVSRLLAVDAALWPPHLRRAGRGFYATASAPHFCVSRRYDAVSPSRFLQHLPLVVATAFHRSAPPALHRRLVMEVFFSSHRCVLQISRSDFQTLYRPSNPVNALPRDDLPSFARFRELLLPGLPKRLAGPGPYRFL